MKPIVRETIIDRRQPQLRWSAVFGGTAVAIGAWCMLESLVLGIALCSSNGEHYVHFGIGTGVWWLIVSAVALFAGGLVAGRLSGTRERGAAALHGAVVWGICAALGLWATLATHLAIIRDHVALTEDGPATGHTGKMLVFDAIMLCATLAAAAGGAVLAASRRRVPAMIVPVEEQPIVPAP
jgi:hypothetical protein